MMHFLIEYLLFLAKAMTGVVAILLLLAGIFAIAGKGKRKGKLKIRRLNEKYQTMRDSLQQVILNKKEYKKFSKQEKKANKTQGAVIKRKVFVLHFKGDIKASAVASLREEITAVLAVASLEDEVVLCLESPGGMMHLYGFAASQLQRIRQKGIKLVVIINEVAASGGYLMACVADQIFAAPFAIVGSIGVIAQLPNFHRVLKKNDVDFEQVTAGEYKRTLTLFGENTEKGRQKFQEEIDDAHELFKNFVVENRPQINIQEVATGEHWFGIRALQHRLVDALQNSDDYLLNASESADIYEVCYTLKKTWADKIGMTAQAAFDKIALGWKQQEKTTLFKT